MPSATALPIPVEDELGYYIQNGSTRQWFPKTGINPAAVPRVGQEESETLTLSHILPNPEAGSSSTSEQQSSVINQQDHSEARSQPPLRSPNNDEEYNSDIDENRDPVDSAQNKAVQSSDET